MIQRLLTVPMCNIARLCDVAFTSTLRAQKMMWAYLEQRGIHLSAVPNDIEEMVRAPY